MSDDKKKLEYLNPESLSEAAKLVDFEGNFYRAVADNEHFRIIPIPTYDGTLLLEDEKQELIIDAMENQAAIVYQIVLDNGDYIVFSVNPVNLRLSGKIGYIPATEYEHHS